MCGILGYLGSSVYGKNGLFQEALDLLSHRGPDDSGIFESEDVLLGHRRLSIIDLSSAGHQPMLDVFSGNVICYNGEVYNYIELREELENAGHCFSTQTDTEVVLKAYQHWGVDCLNRFNGMWSLAIWEATKKRIFVARDRYGVKPFYLTEKRNGFAFASEPKALLHLFPELRAVDHRALFDFLASGELYTTRRSFYDGIKLLPPAHYGFYSLESKKFTLKRFWNLPDRIAEFEADSVFEEKFSLYFDDAVRIRQRSDVPVGVSLSGGLDSTAVLASMHKFNPGASVTCFTSVYGSDSRGEQHWADTAAAPYGIHPIAVDTESASWLDTMNQIVWHMDGPGYSPAVYPVWNLMKRARECGVPVLLEGQGADEAFGGYPQYSVLQFISQVKSAVRGQNAVGIREVAGIWRRMVETFTFKYTLLWMFREQCPWLIDRRRMRQGALSVLNSQFVEHARGQDRMDLPEQRNPEVDTVTERLWIDFTNKILPGLLHYGDAISMAHSIESRLPFMDYRLIEWIFSCRSEVKIREGRTKWLIRQYLERVGQPAIARRPDKLGYPTPVDKWMSSDSGAIPRQLLLRKESRCLEFCDERKLDRLISLHCEGRSGVGNHLYRLISTEIWMRECMA